MCNGRLGLAMAIAWGCFFLLTLRQASQPMEVCQDPHCLRPLVSPSDSLSLEMWIYDLITEHKLDANNMPLDVRSMKFKWRRLEDSCDMSSVTFDFSEFKTSSSSSSILSSQTIHIGGSNSDVSCNLTFPEFSRWRFEDKELQDHGQVTTTKPLPLKGKFILLRERNTTIVQNGQPLQVPRYDRIAETVFDLTRIVQRHPRISFSSTFHPTQKTQKTQTKPSLIPHFKYKRQAIVLRLVADSQLYLAQQPFRGDGYQYSTWKSYVRPPFHVDDVALRHSSQIELAPPPLGDMTNRPPVSIQIKLSIIPPLRHVLHRQMNMGMNIVEGMLNEDELDEIRFLISDEYMYRFVLTQIITVVHVWLDYLAFRNEVKFYVGKDDIGGISMSTVWTRFVCDFIIFLYLLDGGGTSWFVLLSIGSGVGVSLWKVYKFLKPQITGTFPFVTWGTDPSRLTTLERRTVNYDGIARTYLGLILYPLVAGSALYARNFYTYSSWYSWLVSNLANAVYTFGFISLCPQLYINYRLKSVAHLPWKVFMYKLFSTFVDDIFAFLIQMPLKHKLMTLRDDIVFVCFLGQAYIYRVDKSRSNEFGYAYDETKTEIEMNGDNDKTNKEKES